MDFYAEIAAESHTPFLLKSFIVDIWQGPKFASEAN